MFNVIPALKVPVHSTYFHQSFERVRHFKATLLSTVQEKCSDKPLLKEKIHGLMQAFLKL